MPKKRRLFIDPGSKSAGWALFKGKRFLRSGTLKAPNQKAHAFTRLGEMGRQWEIVLKSGKLGKVEEAHIEHFRKNLAIELHWSVGVLGGLCGSYRMSVLQDCWMASWQRFCGFKKSQLLSNSKLVSYTNRVSSEDELSAIGIGIWYTQTKL